MGRRRIETWRAARSGITVPAEYEPGRRCKACGAKWKDAEALAAHLVRNAECRQYYTEERHVGELLGRRFLQGTVYWRREEKVYKPWFVMAVSPQGKLFTLRRCQTRKEALDLVRQAETVRALEAPR